MTFDRAEAERLIAETREDDQRMTPRPWTASNRPAVFKTVQGEANVSRWYNVTSESVTLDDVIGIALLRNNARPLAEQLHAAAAEVKRLTTELEKWLARDAAGASRMLDQHIEIKRLRAEVEAMRLVIDAAEIQRDRNDDDTEGVFAAVDAYRIWQGGRE